MPQNKNYKEFVDLVSVENCIFTNKCNSYYVFHHLHILVTCRHNYQARFGINDS